MKFKNQAKTLFFDAEVSYSLDEKERYNIILSPSLYWVKHITLPVKYLREVKKLAPSIFEEILPQGNYSYVVYKETEGNFLLFAYEDKKIIDLLEIKGISLHSVRSISFAQDTFDEGELYLLDEKRVITKKDGIVLLLPSAWFQRALSLEEKELNPSTHTIKLEQFHHIVSEKTLYRAVGLLFVFALLLSVEYFMYNQHSKAVTQERETLFTRYKLKPTMMQNKAILSSYTKVATKQEHLRKYLQYVEKLDLKKDEYIEDIRYKDDVLEVSIIGVDASKSKRALSILSKEHISFDKKILKDKMLVEMKL